VSPSELVVSPSELLTSPSNWCVACVCQVRVEISFEPVAGDYTGAAGIVENVVLMGTPADSASEAGWAAAASMVAGRLVSFPQDVMHESPRSRHHGSQVQEEVIQNTVY
jgi:hypothetical protein